MGMVVKQDVEILDFLGDMLEKLPPDELGRPRARYNKRSTVTYDDGKNEDVSIHTDQAAATYITQQVGYHVSPAVVARIRKGMFGEIRNAPGSVPKTFKVEQAPTFMVTLHDVDVYIDALKRRVKALEDGDTARRVTALEDGNSLTRRVKALEDGDTARRVWITAILDYLTSQGIDMKPYLASAAEADASNSQPSK
jgi:hypothetical protein